MDGKVAGKIINFYEAEKLTNGFATQNYGVTYTRFNKDLVIKLLSQDGVEDLAIYNGLNDRVPCLVLVPMGSKKEFVGEIALEFGSSCPYDC